jgi:hypothetical protein
MAASLAVNSGSKPNLFSFSWIFYIAAEWGLEDLKFYTMYHSNRSFSGGLGYTYKNQLNIATMYNSEPVAVRGFSGGVFDIVVGYRFNKKM